jgi:ABC-2 type transport system ATP-binding protein
VIELDGVEKTFSVRVKRGRLRRERREVRAVDGISFRIEPGELVGYVGPNGAGKSTTVKMLTGILVPSGGRISVVGLDPSRRRIQLARRIGVVFGQRVQLWWDLPLRDSRSSFSTSPRSASTSSRRCGCASSSPKSTANAK